MAKTQHQIWNNRKILHSLIDSGVDVITSGNHIWDQKDTLIYIERDSIVATCQLSKGNAR